MTIDGRGNGILTASERGCVERAIRALFDVIAFAEAHPDLAWCVDVQQAENDRDTLIRLRDGTLGQ